MPAKRLNEQRLAVVGEVLTLTCFVWMSAHEYFVYCTHAPLCFPSLSVCLYSGLPLSSSSTCPCLNESRGALFLALCHHPRGPCLLLLYFWDTRCMMGSQWPPHSLSTHSHIALHSFVAVTCAEGELGYSWDGHGAHKCVLQVSLCSTRSTHLWG